MRPPATWRILLWPPTLTLLIVLGAVALAHAAADELFWVVTIKDRVGRFPENALLAVGWGWALFPVEDIATNTATDFTADCMARHEPARDTDWVYTQGYPVLRD